MKKKTILQMIAMCLTIVLMITSVGIENISAFWNQDSKNDRRDFAQVTVRLMKCYHKEKNDPEYSKHYDSNGNHVLSNEVIKQDEKEWMADSENNKNKTVDVKHFTVSPRVNNDYRRRYRTHLTPTSTSMNTRCPMTRVSRLITLS